jgi:hypothetical protein
MIATVPPKRKDGGSSFTALFNYMRYELKDDEALEERGNVMLFNLLDEQIIVQEMQIVAQMNHRVRDPVYHYILAWPLEEKPGPGEIRNCVSRTLAALGLRAHQACAIGHSDTASYHVHVMVNRVHPETYKAHAPQWSHYSLDEACRRLEHLYGWQEARGLYRWDTVLNAPKKTEKALLETWREEREAQALGAAGRAAKVEQYSDQGTLEAYCKGTPAKAIRAWMQSAKELTWQTVHGTLHQFGLRLHASQGYAERTHSLSNRSPAKRHESFTISNTDGTLHVKASRALRALFAGKDMRDWRDQHLGPFAPNQITRSRDSIKEAYSPRSVPKRDPATRELRQQGRKAAREALLDRYRQEKTAFETEAKAHFVHQKEQVDRQLALLNAHRQQQRARVKASSMDPVLKQLAYGTIAADYLKDSALLKDQLTQERKACKFIVKDEWITRQAEQGVNAAISYVSGLRYAEQRRQKKVPVEAACSISPAVPERHEPYRLTYAPLTWRFDRVSASVSYQLNGITAFIDRGPRIEFTPGGMHDDAVVLGLQIAVRKYGKTLKLTGSAAFKQRVAELNQGHKLGIAFSNPEMQLPNLKQLTPVAVLRSLESVLAPKEPAGQGTITPLAPSRSITDKEKVVFQEERDTVPDGPKRGITRPSFPTSATTKAPLHVPPPLVPENEKVFETPSRETDSEVGKAATKADPLSDTVIKDPVPAKAAAFLLPSTLVIREAKEQSGSYSGKVLGMDENYVYQDAGRQTVIRHRRAVLAAALPSLEGRSIRVQYKDGSATVTDTAYGRSRGTGRS